MTSLPLSELDPSTIPPAPPLAAPAPPLPFSTPYETNVLPDYAFDPALSLDENYMTLVLIYARLSMSKRGNMACLIATPPPPSLDPTSSAPSTTLNPIKAILAHSNNTPLPTPTLPAHQKQPELHAEARCISLAARNGTALVGSTLYLSFPPCTPCFQLVIMAGIKRCVYRRSLLVKESVALARKEGVELVEWVDDVEDERVKDRVGEWWRRRGETKEVTRARLDEWWKAQGVGGEGDEGEGETGAGDGEEAPKGTKGKKRKLK